MKWIDRAFASSDQLTGVIDRYFTTQNASPDDETYSENCLSLYRCWKALYERGIEMMPYRVIAFMKYVIKENQDDAGELCYIYSMGEDFGPYPYWFFDRMNFLYEPLPFAQDSNQICRRISCVPIFGLY